MANINDVQHEITFDTIRLALSVQMSRMRRLLAGAGLVTPVDVDVNECKNMWELVVCIEHSMSYGWLAYLMRVRSRLVELKSQGNGLQYFTLLNAWGYYLGVFCDAVQRFLAEGYPIGGPILKLQLCYWVIYSMQLEIDAFETDDLRRLVVVDEFATILTPYASSDVRQFDSSRFIALVSYPFSIYWNPMVYMLDEVVGDVLGGIKRFPKTKKIRNPNQYPQIKPIENLVNGLIDGVLLLCRDVAQSIKGRAQDPTEKNIARICQAVYDTLFVKLNRFQIMLRRGGQEAATALDESIDMLEACQVAVDIFKRDMQAYENTDAFQRMAVDVLERRSRNKRMAAPNNEYVESETPVVNREGLWHAVATLADKIETTHLALERMHMEKEEA